jgi:hypothetical protein
MRHSDVRRIVPATAEVGRYRSSGNQVRCSEHYLEPRTVVLSRVNAHAHNPLLHRVLESRVSFQS